MTLSKKQTEQRNEILRALYLNGNLSRADLSRLLDITPATMTALTSHLLVEGTLSETDEEPNASKLGRKKIGLEVRPDCAYYIGMELTDRKVFLCLTDNLGRILTEKIYEEDLLSLGAELASQRVLNYLTEFLSQSTYPVSAIGIAVPGHYDQDEHRLISNNSFWSQFDLAVLGRRLAIPVYIKNNVKCMALRELYLGEDKKTHNFLFMNLRRGLFASYVYQGEIYGDENNLVGEVGHIVVNPNGEICEGCGQAGCLQTYASITWILRKVSYAFEAGKTPYLSKLVSASQDIRLSHIFLAYRMGDDLIRQIIEQALDYLAVQLHNVQMMLDIDTIYVHGRLFEDPEIAARLHGKLDQTSTIIQANRTMTRHIKSYDPMLGALGASSLAIQKHFIEQSSR